MNKKGSPSLPAPSLIYLIVGTVGILVFLFACPLSSYRKSVQLESEISALQYKIEEQKLFHSVYTALKEKAETKSSETLRVPEAQPLSLEETDRLLVIFGGLARQNQLDRWYIRPGCAGVLMEQDMAGTNGPLISPAMFRDMCQPYLAERISHVKQHVDQVVFHNCGHTIPLMDMFIDAGVDCYQSLQTTAGMEVGGLKKRFGNRLAFWGGIAVEVLIQGSPDDVRREVRQAMQRGAPGGGFILGPSHSIAMNTRYDNFMALLDEFVALREKF